MLTTIFTAIQGRGNGFGNPISSFGAGVARVPPPIFTMPQKTASPGIIYPHLRRDSVARESLPPITQVINRDRDQSYSPGLAGYSQSPYANFPVQVPQNSLAGLDMHGDPIRSPHCYDDTEVNDPIDANPYAHRADQIGLSHHIPGVGLLDDILAPPGWKEGDEPIDQREARILFNSSRSEARGALDASVGEARNLPAEQQEIRNVARDKQWDAQFKLDQLLLKERVSIYDMYQERQYLKLNQAGVKKPSPTRMLPTIHPQPINAMASVPPRLQTMYPSSVASSPDSAGIGLPQSGVYGISRSLPGI